MNFSVQLFHCLDPHTVDNNSFCRQCYILFIEIVKKHYKALIDYHCGLASEIGQLKILIHGRSQALGLSSIGVGCIRCRTL